MLPTSLDSRNRVVFAAPGHGHSHQETVPGHADLGSSAQHRTPEDMHPVPSLTRQGEYEPEPGAILSGSQSQHLGKFLTLLELQCPYL